MGAGRSCGCARAVNRWTTADIRYVCRASPEGLDEANTKAEIRCAKLCVCVCVAANWFAKAVPTPHCHDGNVGVVVMDADVF